MDSTCALAPAPSRHRPPFPSHRDPYRQQPLLTATSMFLQGWNNPEARQKPAQPLTGLNEAPGWLSCCWAGLRKRPPSSSKASHTANSDVEPSSHSPQLGEDKAQEKGDKSMEGRINDAEETERQKARKDRYMNAASKLRVEQVVEQTQTNATLDFDYLAYLVISGACCACCALACAAGGGVRACSSDSE